MPFQYSDIKGNFHLLWTTFKNYLVESINETDKSVFELAWKSKPERTQFYFDTLLPKIAAKMNLEFEKEMNLRVDGTFYKKAGQSSKIPIILLESENDAFTSHGEFHKLCLLNAPLKVLMICNDWNDASKKMLTEKFWGYIIEDFAEESSLTGFFAIIIGEWNETLKFHTYVYDNMGNSIESEDALLIEK